MASAHGAWTSTTPARASCRGDGSRVGRPVDTEAPWYPDSVDDLAAALVVGAQEPRTAQRPEREAVSRGVKGMSSSCSSQITSWTDQSVCR